MAVTMQNIAEKIGVSQVTVSRVFSNHPRISKATRERVLREARRLNYRPNAIARSLATRRTNTLGLVVPDITNPFVSELTRFIGNNAGCSDYSLIMCVTDNSPEKEEAAINTLMERRVDGMVLNLQSYEKSQYLRDLQREKFPFVLSGWVSGNKTDYDYVVTDLAEGAYLAVSHLVRLGHKRIAFLKGSGADDPRMVGYKRALQEAGLGFDERLVVEHGFTLAGGREATGELLAMKDRPTAIFALSDFLAIGAMDALEDAGMTVPRDMAIVGFDDVLLGSRLKVPLTTVAQPIGQIGKLVVETLLEKIKKPADEPWQVMLKPQLVVRESCGAKLRELEAGTNNHYETGTGEENNRIKVMTRDIGVLKGE